MTTRGFKSLLDMGYEKRFDHYDLMIDPVPPIINMADRFEVDERMAADGSNIKPLDEEALANTCIHAWCLRCHRSRFFTQFRT